MVEPLDSFRCASGWPPEKPTMCLEGDLGQPNLWGQEGAGDGVQSHHH